MVWSFLVRLSKVVQRLLIGINSGLNAGLAPLYLAEISPVSMRGSIGTVYQLVITITILLSQVLGLKGVLGTEWGWPWLLAVTVIPAAIQCATLPLCPESPKYLLLNKGQELHAQRDYGSYVGVISLYRSCHLICGDIRNGSRFYSMVPCDR
ncbi:Solute carrier family 2, facilitated glucose transporter member 3 [Papilio xuthus]|uniref:Solute carrier family 2, facilitated glucose transporter member 3 n=1 Tax=Papilio xuthus TaxID=66420 RepID=A0A0N1I9K9_PAPXU|nr:Solute carrier family 2, facilitated glucose transporter member 3 [Papilio xuthus]